MGIARLITAWRTMGLVQRRQYYGLLFVLPAVIFFLIFFLYPIVIGFGLSLTDFTLLKPPVWVGLKNYQDLLSDRLFLKSLNVTFGFVLGSTVPVWVISLAMALLFFQRFPGRELMKVLFFTPLLPSVVVVSVIWKLLLHPAGLLSSVIGPIVGQTPIKWLFDLQLSPIMSVVVHDWHIAPFYMIIWLSGLTAIPPELRDAARVDGRKRAAILPARRVALAEAYCRLRGCHFHHPRLSGLFHPVRAFAVSRGTPRCQHDAGHRHLEIWFPVLPHGRRGRHFRRAFRLYSYLYPVPIAPGTQR